MAIPGVVATKAVPAVVKAPPLKVLVPVATEVEQT